MSPVAQVFAYSGLSVRVTSAAADDLAWLEEFAAPAFTVEDTVSADCAVTLAADDERYQAARAHGAVPNAAPVPWFSFDSQEAYYPLWHAPAGVVRVYDPEIDLFYTVDPTARQVEILARSGTRAPRIALLRLVRELATAHAHGQGALHLHASAFAFRGRAVIAVGPKRAGKTSLLLHALGERGARYIANDRVFLSLRGQGSATVRGMPTVVTIRADGGGLFRAHDLARARSYRAYFTRGEAAARSTAAGNAAQDAPLSISPAHLCDLAATTAIASAPVAAVLFPRVDDEETGVRLRPLDAGAATKRLRDARIPVCDSLLTRTLLPARAEGPSVDVWAALTARTPTLECVLGRGAYDDATARAALLDRLAAGPRRANGARAVPA